MKDALIAISLSVLLLPFPAQAQQAGGGDIVFTPRDPEVRPVLFSHEKHIAKPGIKCGGCHYRIFQMARGSYRLNMDTITKGNFCGTCHNGQKAFDVKDGKNCMRCHK